MWDSLARPDVFLFVMFWGALVLGYVAHAGMTAYRKHLATKMDHELKLEMLARGMSADDIERVIAARPASKQPATSEPDLTETQPYVSK